MNPTDETLAARRRSVAAEEASALREEVVRWVRDGEAGEAAAGIIRELVRDGLAEQVEMALNSRDLAGQLGDELRARLSERFADDLRAVVVAEVKRALAQGVLGDAELAKLRQEMRAEVREALAGRTSRRPGGAAGGGLAPRGPDPRWWLGAAAAVFVRALGLLAGVWWMARAPVGDSTGGDGGGTTVGAGSETAGVATGPAGTAAAGGTGSTDAGVDGLFAAWRGLAPAPPAGLAVDGGDFACWFPAETRTSLDALAAAARGGEADVGARLRGAFDPCATAGAGGSRKAVFAAQAAARRALVLHAGADWSGCAARPDPAPNAASFVVDGVSGPSTHRLLTAYLTCRGVGAAVSFDDGSDDAGHLFAVYLALTDPILR